MIHVPGGRTRPYASRVVTRRHGQEGGGFQTTFAQTGGREEERARPVSSVDQVPQCTDFFGMEVMLQRLSM